MSLPVDAARLVAQVADTVRSVPGVAGLHADMFGEVATYLPGDKVPGIRIGEDGTEVHIAITGQFPVRHVAGAVQEAVARLVPGTVDVTVEDIQPPPAAAPQHSGAQ